MDPVQLGESTAAYMQNVGAPAAGGVGRAARNAGLFFLGIKLAHRFPRACTLFVVTVAGAAAWVGWLALFGVTSSPGAWVDGVWVDGTSSVSYVNPVLYVTGAVLALLVLWYLTGHGPRPITRSLWGTPQYPEATFRELPHTTLPGVFGPPPAPLPPPAPPRVVVVDEPVAAPVVPAAAPEPEQVVHTPLVVVERPQRRPRRRPSLVEEHTWGDTSDHRVVTRFDLDD